MSLKLVEEAEAQSRTGDDELALYRRHSRLVIEQLNETIPDEDTGIDSHQSLSFSTAKIGKLDTSSYIKSVGTRWQLSPKEVQASSGDSGNQYLLNTFASAGASISKETCDWSCRSQCLPRKSLESSHRLTELLGTLFCSYRGIPFPSQRTYKNTVCVQRENASFNLTYHLLH